MTFTATADSVEQAISLIDGFNGRPEHFILRIPLSIIGPIRDDTQLITGMQMAVITDRILRKQWWPKGFRDEGGHRLYFYGVE